MVLYTIVSEYAVFFRPEKDRTVERRVGGALLTGEERPEGLLLGRIISTDPKDYLRYSPGMLVENRQIFKEKNC